jgi:pyruvate kinase
MEKVRLSLTNGQDVIIQNDQVDKPFDEIIQFSDQSYVVKGENGLRIPLRSIVTYQIMESSNG